MAAMYLPAPNVYYEVRTQRRPIGHFHVHLLPPAVVGPCTCFPRRKSSRRSIRFPSCAQWPQARSQQDWPDGVQRSPSLCRDIPALLPCGASWLLTLPAALIRSDDDPFFSSSLVLITGQVLAHERAGKTSLAWRGGVVCVYNWGGLGPIYSF